MIDHLFQSTAFALLAAALTLAFRGNRAPVRYGIWLAASLKFLVPFALLISLGSQFPWRTGPVIAPAMSSFAMPSFGLFPPIPTPSLISASASPRSLTTALITVWLLGFLAVAISWWNRWRHVRTAVRHATPLPVNCAIPVLSSPERLEPGVFGIRRPVLLLPHGLAALLTPAQLDAVLSHELCHVRRRDNLAAAIHMFVEAVFWFHPLVWWIGVRLMEERERACDEAVLATSLDPEVYAEGILSVCKVHLASPLPCMSGVAGGNLKKRIEEIMTNREAHHLTLGRKLLLAAAALGAVAGPILVGLANAPVLPAQSTANAKPLAFEVASIRLSEDTAPRAFYNMRSEPDGRLIIRGVPVYMLIARSYGVPFQSPRLSGGPDWTRSDRYDIEARPEKGVITPDLPASVQDQRTRQMIQALLADRFKLKIRREDKEIPIYALVIAKSGSKLQKSKTEDKDCSDTVPCHAFNGGQGRGLHGKAVSTADLVGYVENWTDRPLLDKTGIQGLYDIETTGWLPMRPRQAAPRDPSTPPSAEELADADPATPTIFMIFDRLGLKMEPQKAAVPVYIIESIDRPTAN